jgi:hypothetical protein
MDALAAAAAAAASSDRQAGHDMLLDAMGMMDDHTGHHDSQMITQEISDDDGEDNTQGGWQGNRWFVLGREERIGICPSL